MRKASGFSQSGMPILSKRTTMVDLLQRLWVFVSKDKLFFVGGFIVITTVVFALFAPWISPYDPNVGNGELRLAPPGTAGHPLGVDDQGRDILSRLIWGGRISLWTTLIPICLAFIVSIVLGLCAGFLQGRTGGFIMRILDVLLAFPTILFAISIAAVLGSGIYTIMATIAIANIPYMTRVLYAAVVAEKGKEYIDAARILGASRFTILFKELLPNVISPLIVYSTSLIGVMIVFSSGLSFLGLGIQPPDADWGKMTADGMQALTRGALHSATIPGLVILIVSLGFNWLGDGLRDLLDPHKR